jgi:hypothetical protein
MSTAITLPDNLPNVASARLPELYSGAREALSKCERIDECKDWADKAEAMASYAKQAKDDSLRVACDRIQARAIRRCGELLKQIPKESGGRPAKETRRDAPPSFSPRQEAARAAGLSRDQQKTAIRVANVPREEFEREVERPKPPTVTELAERGKRPAAAHKPLVDLKGRDPADFKAATQALGVLLKAFEFCADTDPAAVARGASAKEKRALREHASGVQDWLKRLIKEIDR